MAPRSAPGTVVPMGKSRTYFAAAAILAAALAGCSTASSGQVAQNMQNGSGPSSTPERPARASAAAAASAGRLSIGTLVPQTGQLAFMGPAQAAGVRLAVKNINADGGVLGTPVELIDGDSGDVSDPATASKAAAREIALGVDAIIGPPSSALAEKLAPEINGAGVLLVSPSATAAGLSSLSATGLWARTVASDADEAVTIASLVGESGATSVCLVVPDDDAGRAYATAVRTALPATVQPAEVGYLPTATDFAPVAAGCKGSAAVVLAGFAESPRVAAALIAAGITTPAVKLFTTGSNTSAGLYQGLPAGSLTGAVGVLPGADAGAAFNADLRSVDPTLAHTDFGAEAYDATMLVALAAVAAGSSEPADIAAALPKVSSGGVPCSTFKECSTALAAGEDVNYVGVSGPADLAADGNVTQASMGVYTFDAAGPTRTRTVLSPLRSPDAPPASATSPSAASPSASR